MCYLLKGTIENLAKLSPQELLSSMLQQAEYHKQEHGDAEQASWRNSLYRLIQFLQANDLGQLYLVAEYALLNERIDALLFGFQKGKTEILATIIELKQWQALAENREQRITEVNVQIGQRTEYRIHPVYQTQSYKRQLKHHHSYFEDKKDAIRTLQYLDQFEDDKAKFFEPPYQEYRGSKGKLERYLVVKKEAAQLIKHLKSWYETEQIDQQHLEKEFEAFLQGHYVMGEVGLSGIEKILDGQANAIMLDDQCEMTAQISSLLEEYHQNRRPLTIIIQGDPGTGKTIVGLYVLFLAQQRGISKERCILTFAKSRMLLEVLKEESGMSSIPYITGINPQNYDVIVIDEAHRLTNIEKMIQQCFGSRKNNIVVFLVDDRQRIRPDEQGSVAALAQASQNLGIDHDIFILKTQKRSGFKDDYVNKVKHLLYGDPLPEQTHLGDFQIHVRSNLQAIDQELLELQKQGYMVKWFAPFCWKWLSQDKQQINFDHKQKEWINDIIVGDFKKQWNPKDSKQKNPSNNQYDWYKGQKPHHFEQVGSIYTAQGLDYDYIGLIWWSDLKWNKVKQTWEADLQFSQDIGFNNEFKRLLNKLNLKDDSPKAIEILLTLFLNQYYVLLTRARKGIYLWFKDQDTKEYVQHLLDSSRGSFLGN